MNEPEGAGALGVDDERESENKKELEINTEMTKATTQTFLTTAENLINLPLSLEPQLTEFLPIYSFPKTTVTTPLTNSNYPLFSNQMVQPAPYVIPNPPINYHPQISTVQINENSLPPQMTTQASTPNNQSNIINNIEQPQITNHQLYNMMITMQQQQHEINKQNIETINQLKTTINQMSVLIQDLMNTRRSKVIPPGKYRTDGGEPLLVYLKRFEDYVKHTYPGSQSGMTFLLENYLQGHILEVYKLSLQTTTDYPEIKELLLKWEKNRLKTKGERYAQDYKNIVRRPDESIQLYAMRFIALAEKAFPGSDVRTLPTVRDKFIGELPANVQASVRSSIISLETIMGLKVQWDNLVVIVETSLAQLAQETNVPSLINPEPPIINLEKTAAETCMWATQGVLPQPPLTYAQKLKLPQVQQPATPKPPKKNPNIQANQNNQQPNNSQGAKPKAPKIHVNYSQGKPSRGQSPSSNAPSRGQSPSSNAGSNRSSSPNSNGDFCSYCRREGHRIINCPQRPLCLFCSKRGHTADRCYSAVNRCIRCEVDGHIVDDCPKGRKNLSNPNLECPICNGAHYGKDCKMKIRGLNH